MTDAELQSLEQERANRSLFVQEVVLSSLVDETSALTLEGPSEESTGGQKECEESSSPSSEGINQQVHSTAPSTSSAVVASCHQQQQQQQAIQQPLQPHQKGTAQAPKRSPRSPVPVTRPQQLQSHQPLSVVQHRVQIQPAACRVLTGTGTIREVTPPVRGSPGPTRRKPVRPFESRNQSTEPPPPH